MKAYKAFNKDLTCRGYQFDEHIINITDKANCVRNGFHCAENPLDCLKYYPDWNSSVYYIVNAGGDIDEDGIDSKISCTELTLIKKLDVSGFIWECLEYMYKHPSRKCGRVYRERADISEGFAIVRGKKPIVKGRSGTVFGIAKEYNLSSEIFLANIIVIDGKNFLHDVWYDITGSTVDFEDVTESTVNSESEGDI